MVVLRSKQETEENVHPVVQSSPGDRRCGPGPMPGMELKVPCFQNKYIAR